MSGKSEMKNEDAFEHSVIDVIILDFIKAYVFFREDTKFSFTYVLPTSDFGDAFDDLLAERFWTVFRLYVSIVPHSTSILSFIVSHNPEDLE